MNRDSAALHIHIVEHPFQYREPGIVRKLANVKRIELVVDVGVDYHFVLSGTSANRWRFLSGLFHKVAAMSGSPLGIWPIPQNQLEVAKKQAKLVGCPDDTAANIIKCLKTKPANDLGQSLTKFKVRYLFKIWFVKLNLCLF